MQSAPPSIPSESRPSRAPAEKYEFFKVIQGYLDQAAKVVDNRGKLQQRSQQQQEGQQTPTSQL